MVEVGEEMTEDSSPISTEKAFAPLIEYVQNGLSVNALRISHLNDLNKAAFKKYEKIAETSKTFQGKMEPLNEQCVALGEQLSALDKILENITKMEEKVADLNSLVTSLEDRYKNQQNGKTAPISQ